MRVSVYMRAGLNGSNGIVSAVAGSILARVICYFYSLYVLIMLILKFEDFLWNLLNILIWYIFGISVFDYVCKRVQTLHNGVYSSVAYSHCAVSRRVESENISAASACSACTHFPYTLTRIPSSHLLYIIQWFNKSKYLLDSTLYAVFRFNGVEYACVCGCRQSVPARQVRLSDAVRAARCCAGAPRVV